MKIFKALQSCSSSTDGHWINVHEFTEAGVTLKSSDISAANASKIFQIAAAKKPSILLKEVKEWKAYLFQHTEALPWKANEFEFYIHTRKLSASFALAKPILALASPILALAESYLTISHNLR